MARPIGVGNVYLSLCRRGKGDLHKSDFFLLSHIPTRATLWTRFTISSHLAQPSIPTAVRKAGQPDFGFINGFTTRWSMGKETDRLRLRARLHVHFKAVNRWIPLSVAPFRLYTAATGPPGCLMRIASLSLFVMFEGWPTLLSLILSFTPEDCCFQVSQAPYSEGFLWKSLSNRTKF